MYRLLISAILLFCSSFFVLGQEIGIYGFPQVTSIHNKENRNDEIYQHVPTMSGGAGIFIVHFFNGNRTGNRMRYGFTLKDSKPRFGIRGDLIYSAHNQKFKSRYRIPGGKFGEHEGKKRLTYGKLAVSAEYSMPIQRHINFIVFAGPQLSYLIKADGGIVSWEKRSDHDFYDLPVADDSYWKKYLFDASLGFGLDFKYTKWFNFYVIARSDWSVSSVEDIGSFGDLGAYNLEGNDSRKGSHNTTMAVAVGVEYKFHRPEHARTKY